MSPQSQRKSPPSRRVGKTSVLAAGWEKLPQIPLLVGLASVISAHQEIVAVKLEKVAAESKRSHKVKQSLADHDKIYSNRPLQISIKYRKSSPMGLEKPPPLDYEKSPLGREKSRSDQKSRLIGKSPRCACSQKSRHLARRSPSSHTNKKLTRTVPYQSQRKSPPSRKGRHRVRGICCRVRKNSRYRCCG